MAFEHEVIERAGSTDAEEATLRLLAAIYDAVRGESGHEEAVEKLRATLSRLF